VQGATGFPCAPDSPLSLWERVGVRVTDSATIPASDLDPPYLFLYTIPPPFSPLARPPTAHPGRTLVAIARSTRRLSLLTHLDSQGRANMVDVTDKAVTSREAVAEARVRMRPETLRLIQDGGHPKGDVFAVARIAGIQAAKRTHELIPLCHPLLLTSVKVELQADGEDAVRIEARCKLAGQTGVEMEALTAASVAALTIYDMCKAVDKGMTIEGVRLLEKLGGKSGHYRAEEGR